MRSIVCVEPRQARPCAARAPAFAKQNADPRQRCPCTARAVVP
jgi:hypothetical protein